MGCPGGAAIFVKRQLPPELNVHEAEDRAMEMLYRGHVEFAVGHGVAVHAEILRCAQNDSGGDGEILYSVHAKRDIANEWERAVELRTEVMPAYEVERMEPPNPQDVPAPGAGRAGYGGVG